MLSRKYGVPGFVALALLLPAGLFSTGCDSKTATKVEPPPAQTATTITMTTKKKRRHAIALNVVSKSGTGNWSHEADPDIVKISKFGAAGEPEHTLVWIHDLKTVQIAFNDADVPQPECPPGCWVCRVDLPNNIKTDANGYRKLKYTVSGMDEDGPVQTIDPYVEIQR